MTLYFDSKNEVLASIFNEEIQLNPCGRNTIKAELLLIDIFTCFKFLLLLFKMIFIVNLRQDVV